MGQATMGTLNRCAETFMSPCLLLPRSLFQHDLNITQFVMKKKRKKRLNLMSLHPDAAETFQTSALCYTTGECALFLLLSSFETGGMWYASKKNNSSNDSGHAWWNRHRLCFLRFLDVYRIQYRTKQHMHNWGDTERAAKTKIPSLIRTHLLKYSTEYGTNHV